jgi:hypothetical protein
MNSPIPILFFGVLLGLDSARAVHVWEKMELTFRAANSYTSAYTDVEIWVDLKGPDFNKRCYGFWDGSNVFRVRVMATKAGKWSWHSRSNQKDDGLNNRRGEFTAVAWTEEDKTSNALRRGIIRPAANGHAFEYADGTPFLLLGDTWYAASTFRFPWFDDEEERPIGPGSGFKDYLRLRKRQGFNAILIIAAFPNWADDGAPWEIWLDRDADLAIRSSWVNQRDITDKRPRDQWRAKDMHNEGGRAFLFPGKVPGYEGVFPDVDRINPEYFKFLDRKIDYLNAHGFIPIIEVARRDITACWARYYNWPNSYARFIQYVWSRYQANNCMFSPVHYDWPTPAASTARLNEAANLVIEKFGHPPFGTPVSCNSSVSSLVNFGGPDENKWLTFHQIGNGREHEYYWYLTEIFHARPARPALNGEPYYAGMTDRRYTPTYRYGAPGGTEADDLCVRSGIYGSFLSGGFGGHIYGAEGIWGADIEPGSTPTMWEAFQWNSANQLQHLKSFAFSEGRRFQELVPDANFVVPHQNHMFKGYQGWAYCARTQSKDFFLAYFEKGCLNRSVIRGATNYGTYDLHWFNPRNGQWTKASGPLKANNSGRIELPDFPSDDDWGLKLLRLAGSSRAQNR